MSESERRQRTISSTPRLTPEEVAGRSFPTAFRGISETDVRAFLKRIAEDLGAVRGREQELMGTIDELEARLRTPRPLDEQELLDALGEETTRLLRSAREAATDIRSKAEERAARLVHDAHEEAQRVRQEADEVLGVRTQDAETVAQAMLEEAEQRASDLMRVADERALEVRGASDRYAEELRARAERESTNEIETARARGASLLEEATTLRQQVIDDLGRRRELLSGQLEELRTGRDQLLDAYRIVKRTFLEATEALAQVEARATAGRTLAGSDPADLAGALAAESDAAGAAGFGPTPEANEPAAAPPADSTVAAAAETPEAEPDEGGAESAADDETPNLGAVDDLFARLRAGAQNEGDGAGEPDTANGDGTPAPEPLAGSGAAASESVEPEPPAEQPAAKPAPKAAKPAAKAVKPVAKAAPAPTGNGEPEVDVTDDDTPAWLTRRDAALTPLRAALVRQIKLTIGNEQNEVLDKVRRHKGRPAAEAALPDVDAQTTAWSAVMVTATASAYRAGLAPGHGAADGDRAGEPAAVPDDLASVLPRAMVEPLRERLVTTIDSAHEPGETSNQVAERIGARYREWKNRSAESSTDDALVAAYSRGVYDSAPDGAVLTWCVPPSGCCVDCADNALEPTRKGEPFPTGQAFPPAHPGCRCALTSDGSGAAQGESVDAESSRPA